MPRRDPSPGRDPDDARPRRKSESYRRPPDDYRPRRRDPSPGPVRSGGRRPRSPPPYFAPDPPPQRESRARHDRHRYSRDEYPRDRHARDYPPPEQPRDRHYRPARRHASPEPKRRSQGYPQPAYDHRDDPDPRSSRRSRAAPPPAHESDGDYDSQRRRHRSQPREASRSPPRRRSTMPASTKAAGPKPKPKAKGTEWWKNPLVQAGARTAFAAGAQAVMQNRKEEGPWFGAKGAKVATAALGAALADGLMGGEKRRH